MDRARIDEFYRRQAPIYDLTRPLFLPGRARAVARLAPRPGHRIADFGCGTGLDFPRLLRTRPARLVGIDASEAMLARARRKHPDVDLRIGDLATIDLGERFDLILASYALSLVAPWEAAVDNMVRHLLPGGRLVILDFHSLEGWARPAAPALAAWLRRFGVRADRPVESRLKALFEDVRVEVRLSGYFSVVAASGPREPPVPPLHPAP